MIVPTECHDIYHSLRSRPPYTVPMTRNHEGPVVLDNNDNCFAAINFPFTISRSRASPFDEGQSRASQLQVASFMPETLFDSHFIDFLS